MEKAKKGQWVEIENVVLTPKERAPQLPEDTKATPLMMWTKGFLVNESAAIGETVKIITLADRAAEGKLVAINPRHEHDFGQTVQELLEVGLEVRKEIESI